MSCPDGLYFDSNLNVCNWPQFVNCQNEETDNPETTTNAIMTTTEELNLTSTTIIAENETTTTEVNGTFMKSHHFDVICPESEDGYSVYVPHPTDCSLYFQCVGNNPTLMSCPDGLYFDSNLNVCNWPQFVNCQNEVTDNPETTTDAIMTTTEELNVTSTTIIAENETTTTRVNGTFMRSSNFDVVCPESEDGYSVYVPHPTDCSLYYQCVGNNPTLMSCPDGLYFDSNLNVCNWPQFVDCQNEETDNPETTTDIIMTTTEDLNLNVTSTTIIAENETTTTGVNGTFMKSHHFDVVCPESEDGYSVYVPHPTDCSLYYQCVGNNPTLMSCPGGLYFDTNLNVCNWPQFVDCENRTDNPETTTDAIMTTTEVFNVTSTTIIAENETTTTGVNGTFMRSHHFDVVCPKVRMDTQFMFLILQTVASTTNVLVKIVP